MKPKRIAHYEVKVCEVCDEEASSQECDRCGCGYCWDHRDTLTGYPSQVFLNSSADLSLCPACNEAFLRESTPTRDAWLKITALRREP